MCVSKHDSFLKMDCEEIDDDIFALVSKKTILHSISLANTQVENNNSTLYIVFIFVKCRSIYENNAKFTKHLDKYLSIKTQINMKNNTTDLKNIFFLNLRMAEILNRFGEEQNKLR